METLEFGCGSSILAEGFEIVPLIPFVWKKITNYRKRRKKLCPLD
ncbi:hypothetical protein LEP1GSC133_2779 [Leptospira borgpetersenii serovar Pomona str. 200901868]|uniref:Uncharacterized protein n=1 Tax=Leptospira borgpetersenii serovar Pomona str. 200901868 TaxID=1192866 RepID=M6W506_LEPBO|nr:hypothetical protein LEP1GSC133_2779 [Leptospira borgpetersenii serovar Pomona str. 200901868]